MNYQSDKKLIGMRIKSIRNKKGISQQTLSLRTGIQNTTISAFENGKRIPNLQSLASIAQALNVTIDELYFGDSSVAFIESAPNKGAKIANCLYELAKEHIIVMPELGNQSKYDELYIARYQPQISRLVKNLEEFFSKEETYSNPNEFSKQLVESVANEINQIDKNIEEKIAQRERVINSSL